MAKKIECDRCGKQEGFTIANIDLPMGWERVFGADLCNHCSKELHKFLSRLPEIAKTVTQ